MKNFIKTLKEKLKNNKGITLAVLVVTVIILIILAGIVIRGVVGDNGFIQTSKDSKEVFEEKELTRNLKLKASQTVVNRNIIDKTDLVDKFVQNLKNDGTIKSEDVDKNSSGTHITVDDKYVYLVEEINDELVVSYEGFKGGVNPKIIDINMSNTTNSITAKINARNADSYKFYIKYSDDANYTLLTPENTTGEYTFTGLSQDKVYDIKFEAINGNGRDYLEVTRITGLMPTGTVTIGDLEWDYDLDVAKFPISTSVTGFRLQYTLTPNDETSWIDIESGAKTQGILVGSTVYARLYDGVNEAREEYVNKTVPKQDGKVTLESLSGTTKYPNEKQVNITENISKNVLTVESQNPNIATAVIVQSDDMKTGKLVITPGVIDGTTRLRVISAENESYNMAFATYVITVEKGDFVVEAEGYEGIYDGKEHSITIETIPETATITYSQEEEGTYVNEKPLYTNVGEYTVYYKVSQAGYNDYYGEETVTITKQKVNNISNLKVSTAGIVTWDAILNATGYEISLDGTNFETATIGMDILSTLVNTKGTKTVTVRGINSDTQNYEIGSIATTNVKVVEASFNVNNVKGGTVDTLSYKVLEGATFVTNGNKLTIKGITTGTATKDLKVVTATIKPGYTFTKWSIASGTITNDVTITAEFTANTNTKYVVKHYQMDLTGNYPATPTETENKTGTTDTNVTPQVKNYEGFTAPETQTVNVNGDETTVVEYKYSRNKYYIDTNAYLDGEYKAGAADLAPYGTFDFYVNGTRVAENTSGIWAQYYYGSTYEVKNIQAKAGKNYRGLSNNSAPISGTLGASNIAINFVFTTNYVITYELNGGQVEGTNPDSYTIESEAITLKNPTKRGYTFKGWSGTDLTGDTNKSVTIAKGSKGNRTYTANWTIETYTISYELNGGSVSETNPESYTIESNAISLINPTKTGYTFKGWSGTDLTGDTNKNVTIAKGSVGNRTYTANWIANTYTVSYNANGGTGAPADATATYDQTFTISKTVPTKTGYTFKGWTTKSDGTDDGYNWTNWSGTWKYIDGQYGIASGKLQLYARWEINQYTVSYNLNSDDMKSWQKQYGERFNLTYDQSTKFTTIKLTGAGGWEMLYIPVTTVVGRTYNFTFDCQNISGFATSYNGLGVQALKQIQNSNCLTDNAINTVYVPKAKDTSTKSYTLTFTATGTTTYIAYNFGMMNDGTEYTIALGNFKFKDTLDYNSAIGTLLGPTKQGYTFNGWYTALSGGNTISAETKVPANNVEYFAHWTANELSFTNQSISKTYSTEAQTGNITVATNGTGMYTYTEVSEKNSGNTATNYISISGTTINIAAKTPVGTYTYVIRATDVNSGKTKDATYTITIGKQTVNPVTNLAVSTAGIVTWTLSSNATGYQISIDGTNFTSATSGVNFLSSITASAGTRTVYVRAINSDSANYQTPSANATKAVTVYSVSLTKGTGISAVTGAGNYISGATVNIGATVSAGYTWSKWTQTSGGAQVSTTNAYSAVISGNWAYTANTTVNTYTISYDLAGGTVSGTNPTSYTVETNTITLINPTKTGYTFAGWTGSNGTTAQTSVSIAKGSTGNKSYTANWTINQYNVTYNTNLNYKFENGTYADIGIKVNWNKNFKIETTVNVPTLGQRYLIAGCHSGETTFNLEINASNKLRVYLGNAYVDVVSTNVIVANQDIKIVFEWNASTKSFSLTGTGSSVNASVSGTCNQMTGISANSLRIGCADYRSGASPFKTLTVKGIKITTSKDYNSTLSDLPSTTSNPGYTFAGWYTAASGGNAVSTTTTVPANNVEYFGHWTSNTYTVTFDFNGGRIKDPSSSSKVLSSTTVSQTHDAKYVLATTPTRPGYTFAGWYTATSGGTQVTTGTDVKITAAQTLYARWTVGSYTLTVNPNGGTWSGSTSNQTFTQNYNTTKTIANPTRIGYTFKGWVLTKTIDSANYVELMYQAPGYAGFSNEAGAKSANTIYLYSQLGQLANFKYNDKYEFIIAADENGKMYKWSQTSNPLNTTEITGYTNIANTNSGLMYNNTSTLLAVSTKNNNWWNAIGQYGSGTNPIANTDNLWTNRPVHFYVKAANDLSNLSSYTITGALDSSNNYIFRDENVTLQAIWSLDTYTISYDLAGGTVSSANPTTYNVNTTTFTLNNPSKTGYTFAGWTGSNGTTAQTSVSIAKGSTGNKSYTATWTINQYTVTCEDYFVDSSNNRKVKLGTSTKTYDYNTSVSGTAWGTDATKSKYYTNYVYKSSTTGTVPANNNLVVYRYFWAWTDLNVFNAAGSQNGATVSFKIGNGSWQDVTNEKNTTQPWGTTYYVKNIRPVNSYEEFDRVSNLTWDSTNGYYSYTPTAAGTSMNIYMKYKKYTVTYNYSENGGTSATKTTDSIAYGSAIDLTPTATKSGWTFVGWNTNKDATTAISTLNMSEGNVILYAIYSKTLTGTFYYYNNQNTKVSKTIYNKATNATITSPAAQGASDNYSFRHWSTSDAANAASTVAASTNITISANTNYYASYQKTVTGTFYYCTIAADNFTYSNAASASKTATAIQYRGYKGAIVNSNFTVPTEVTGSTGGASAQNYIGVATAENSASTVTPTTANTVFYAVYTEPLTFYYYNGSAHTSKQVTRRMLISSGKYSNSLSEAAPVPSNYDGAASTTWSHDANQYSSDYLRAPLATGTNTLYAVYSKSVTATFNYHDGSKAASTTASSTRYYVSKNGGINTFNTNIAVPSAVSTNRTISSIVHTYRGVSTANTANAGVSTPTTANTTYYASYTYPITISYSGNNSTSGSNPANGTGTGYMNYAGTKIGAKITTAANSYSRTGYTFSKWNTAAAGNGTDYNASTAVTFTANTTLYAKWTINNYTVSFDNNYLKNNIWANTSRLASYSSAGTAPSARVEVEDTEAANGYNVEFTMNAGTDGGPYYSAGSKLTVGTTYTWSVEVKASKAMKLKMGHEQAGTKTVDITTSWQRFTNTFTASDTNYKAFVLYVSGTGSSWAEGDKVYIRNLYIEEGNGSQNISSSSKQYNSQLGTLPAPTRSGYTFAGWFTASVGGTQISSTTTVPANNVTYYAHWTPNKYYLDLNGILDGESKGSISGYGTADVYVNGVQKSNDVADYYTQWYTGSTFEVKDIKATTGHTYNGVASGYSLTGTIGGGHSWVYLNFTSNTYTVSFNANGGSGGQSANVTATYGKDMPTISTTAPTRTGYTFGGWYDTSAATGGTQYYTAAGASARTWNKTANTTLYARWTANTYTVSFNVNGGTGGQSAQVTATYDAAMPAISTTAPTRTGYTFMGWYDNSTYTSGTQYYTAAGASARTWNKTAATTLYAGWKINTYTITYDLAGGSLPSGKTNPANYTVTTDTITLNNPTKTGYTFAGWTGSNGTTAQTSVSIAKGSTGNKSYTATWTINQYTVTCEDYLVDSSNGRKVKLGTGTKTYNYNTSVSGTAWGTDTTKSKYYGNYVYKSATSGTVPANNNLVVYRYFWAWSNINVINPEGSEKGDGSVAKFSVSYNGATYVTGQSNENGTSITLPYNATIKIKDIAMQQTYYSLKEVTWGGTALTASNGEYTATVTSAGKGIDIKTKYNTYTVSFNVNGGSGGQSAAVTATYNSAMPTISTTAPTRTGYTFMGWYDNSTYTSGTQYYTAAGASARTWNKASNTTLYAGWKINTYTLTVNPNGGTYNSTTSNSTFTQNFDTSKQVGVATPPGNVTVTFNGNNGTAATTSATASKTFTGWTLSGTGKYVAGSNAGSLNGITRTAKTENGESYENFKYTANNPTGDNWYSFHYPVYTYTSGHTYQIRFKVRVNSVANGGNITFRHGRSSNDWVCLASKGFSATTSGWQDVVLNATFSGTTYDRSSTSTNVTIAPQFQAYTSNLKNTTASMDFDVKDVLIIDTTTGELLQSSANMFWYRAGNGTLTANYSAYSQVTLPNATRTGYTLEAWYDAASGGNKIGNKDAKYTPTGNKTLYAHWTANELTFGNQTITKTFSTSQQTASVTAATNGTGTYKYSKVSGESDISVAENGTITIPASKTANTTGYSVVIRATDSNSGKTKDATYTIKINKAGNPLSVTATQTWSEAFATSAKDKAITSLGGQGTLSYAIQSQKNKSGTAVSYFEISGSNLRRKANTPVAESNYTVVVRVTAAGNDNYNSGYKDITYTVTVTKAGNPLSVTATQTWSEAFATSAKDKAIASSGGQGTLSYAIQSQKNKSGTAVSYFEISGSNLRRKANTPVAESNYTVVVRVTAAGNDNYNSGYKDITYTVTVSKQGVNAPTGVAVSTAGIVTWTASSNATGYQISIDNSNWSNVTSGVNYLSTIIAATGSRTVYVRAVNSDTNNYSTPSSNATKAVSVITLTTSSNNTNYGTVNSSTYNVISGVTYSTSSNTLTVKSGSTTLKTITATKKDATGYTTSFSSWSSTSGTISANTSITANFTRTANTYTVTYNGNGNTGGSTANSTHTYDTAKALTTNGYTKTGYTFTGWSTANNSVNKIYDTGEYTGTHASGASGYNDFKQYAIPAPFASGDVYQLDVDVKGSGTLYNYFYGGSNYLRVGSWTNSSGSSGTSTDGCNAIPLTSSYTHYTVRFTLSSTGDGNVVKYLLFRAMPGCSASIKNVVFTKVGSATQYVNGQSVKNLATSGTVTLYAIWRDSTAPTLSLSKITYREGYDGWEFNNSSVDSNGVVTIGLNGAAGSLNSNIYDVNNEEWYMTYDAYVTAGSSAYPNTGGLYIGSSYYDSNMASKVSSNSYGGNGYAPEFQRNTWTSDSWNGWAGFNVENLRIGFAADGYYGAPGGKIRNMKVWGQLRNTFYLINVSASDNVGVTTLKYASGSQNAAYFASNGTAVSNNQIRVTANGTYTVYAGDAMGNGTVQTITIDRITSKYTVTYNANGGSGAPAAQTFTYGVGETISSVVPTRTGYTFNNWNFNGTVFTPGQRIPTTWGNFTLTAQWVDNINPTYSSVQIKNMSSTGYDVYVYGVSDSGSGINRVQFPTWTENAGQDDIQSNWSTNTAAKGTLQSDGTTWVYRVNTTDHKNEAGAYNTHIYIYDNAGNAVAATTSGNVPTVTATFNSNGGSAASPGTITKAYNNALGTLPTTSRTGYTFAGWWTAASGGSQISTSTVMPASNVTYYAHWTANTYTVKYYNGSTLMGTSTHTYGTAKNLTAIASLGGSGDANYTAFAAWTTANNSTTGIYGNAQSVVNLTATAGGTVNLYVIWYRTAYFYSGNSTSPATANQYKNTSTYWVTSPTPTGISGWSTLGWRADGSAAAASYGSGSVIWGNVGPYFYGVYSKTAYFYSGVNAGTTNTSTLYHNSGSNGTGTYGTQTLSTGTAISGWTFQGWRPDGTATSYYYGYGFTGDTTQYFYAVYYRTVTLAYNGNGNTGGSTASQTATQYYNTAGSVSTASFTTRANGFTKTNYTFVNWAHDSASGTQVAAGGTVSFAPAVGAGVTKTMYAVWKAAMVVGAEVKFGGDSFYIIREDSSTKYLMSKYYIISNNGTYVQTNTNPYNFSESFQYFSYNQYWSVTERDLLYDNGTRSGITAIYTAYMYGERLGVTGYLPWKSDIEALINGGYTTVLNGAYNPVGFMKYWTATVSSNISNIYIYNGDNQTIGAATYNSKYYPAIGVRAVLAVPSSKWSQITMP